MSSLDTVVVKASVLMEGDVIIDGETLCLVEEITTRQYDAKRLFLTSTTRRILGVKVWTTYKEIPIQDGENVTVWHNMLIDGKSLMKGDKVYHNDKLAAVNRIKRVNSKKFILSTTAGKFSVAGSVGIFIAV